MSSEQSLSHEQFMDLPPVQPPKAGRSESVPQKKSPENTSAEQGGEVSAANKKAKSQPVAAQQTDVTDTNAVAQTTQHAKSATLSMPQMADDSDLIEKEWIEKAQEIIARTKDDPHTQSKALGKIKAEYLKKRFDRATETDDEAA
jgi:hypothetical protein